MAVFKCKMCGGELSLLEDANVCECEYCGTTQTVPTADNEKKMNLFNRANRLRFANEFDKAAGVFESIVAEFPEEAEAYWGLVLCKYGIEYVDDPATAKKIPTCHRTSYDGIFEDYNFELALEYADPIANRVYRDEAKAIDRLQKAILEVASKEEPFDVFICYKETAEDGQRTMDSVLAQDIYDALTAKGYKVFFSRITLEDKLGQEYEPYIFAALNSAKVMLAVGTKYEYFNAVWVKNEWARFLELIKKDKSKTLIPCYRDIDAYDMPPEFKNLQGQDMGKLGFIQDLTRGITKIIWGAAEKPIVTTSASTGALTKRGYFFLEDGDFKSADEYFDKALDENPEDSKAYAGKVLAGLHMKDVAEINDSFVKLYDNKNFERAIRFASGADKVQLEDIKENADRKWLVKRLTVDLNKVAKVKEKMEESQEIFDEIKNLAATGTVEAYEKIVRICTDARNRCLNEDFTLLLINSYKRQLNILRVLSSDYEEYTIEDIRNSKYFSRPYLNLSVLAEDVKQMVADGILEKGVSLNTYRILGATEKRLLQKKENDYKRAFAFQFAAERNRDYNNYFAAAEIYASLGDFREANIKATECKQLGENLKAEIEAKRARQEAEIKAKRARQEAEIKAHNDKINALIAEADKALSFQKAIYAENAGKFFGSGAKLKKVAKAEISRLESEIATLRRSLK